METTYLAHHGVKGMHWGVRRYQNADGTLTEAGKRREAKRINKSVNNAIKNNRKLNNIPSGLGFNNEYYSTGKKWDKVVNEHKQAVSNDSQIRSLQAKRAAAYKKADSAYSKNNLSEYEKHLKTGDDYSGEINKRKAQIRKDFIQKYDKALLEDIGYKDVELGKKLIKKYNFRNDKGTYYTAITYTKNGRVYS